MEVLVHTHVAASGRCDMANAIMQARENCARRYVERRFFDVFVDWRGTGRAEPGLRFCRDASSTKKRGFWWLRRCRAPSARRGRAEPEVLRPSLRVEKLNCAVQT